MTDTVDEGRRAMNVSFAILGSALGVAGLTSILEYNNMLNNVVHKLLLLILLALSIFLGGIFSSALDHELWSGSFWVHSGLWAVLMAFGLTLPTFLVSN